MTTETKKTGLLCLALPIQSQEEDTGWVTISKGEEIICRIKIIEVTSKRAKVLFEADKEVIINRDNRVKRT